MTEDSIGIMLVHLVTGKDIVAEVVKEENGYTLGNPLYCELDEYTNQDTAALYFTPLVPMFTGESVVIPKDKVVFMMKPNSLLVNVYQEYVVDIIQKNYAALTAVAKSIIKQQTDMKKTFH